MPSRLDNWKSIAQYMGKSARTLQRWHRVYGLPVHHLAGESGSVYAYDDELDNWLRGRSRVGASEPETSAGSELSEAGFDHVSPLPGQHGFDSGLISPIERGRSAQIVALSARMWDFVSPRNLNRIVLHYREAIDLDPENAPAYAGLAMGLIAQGIWEIIHPTSAFPGARAALHYALLIDPGFKLARTADAWLKMLQSRDWQGARVEFDEVLERTPTCTRTLNGSALLHIAEGSLETAAELLKKSRELSPLSSEGAAFYLWASYLNGRYSHVLEQVNEMRASGLHDPIAAVAEALASVQHYGPRAALERLEHLAIESPKTEGLRGALGYAYALSGEEQRAREILDRLMGSSPDDSSRAPYALALVWIGLDEKHKALECLEQCYASGSLWSLGFRSDPMLEPLLCDPQCLRILNELDYPIPERDSARD